MSQRPPPSRASSTADAGGPAGALRANAEAAAAGLPALMLAAERLAAQAMPGAHGQRRAGPGEEFWQYRAAAAGDAATAIDWRRSARGDTDFVRERERVAAQSAALWVSGGAGMDWRGAADRPTKGARARVLALALALTLLRGGERVGLLDGSAPRTGRTHLQRLAEGLLAQGQPVHPDPAHLRPGQRVVLVGDWLEDPASAEGFLLRAAAGGISGAMVQVLDPVEEAFPFTGAVLFRAPGAAGAHDTRDAAGLRDAYLARLAERRQRLGDAATAAGWRFGTHGTAAPAAEALLWLTGALRQ